MPPASRQRRRRRCLSPGRSDRQQTLPQNQTPNPRRRRPKGEPHRQLAASAFDYGRQHSMDAVAGEQKAGGAEDDYQAELEPPHRQRVVHDGVHRADALQRQVWVEGGHRALRAGDCGRRVCAGAHNQREACRRPESWYGT